MSEPTIACPKCKTEIKLTESLAAPLVQSMKRQFEKKLAQKEADLLEQQEALEKAKASMDQQVATKVKAERTKLEVEAKKKADALNADTIREKDQELETLKTVLEDRDSKLKDAHKAQAELLKKQRALQDKEREMDLTIETKVQQAEAGIREKAKLDAEAGLKLKVVEKDQLITALQTQIEDLKRRAEQGSQQAQGEAQEIELESLLRSAFPRDTIEPVPKGVHGGDALHRVLGPSGQICGTMLWESKRTRNWSDNWLSKLRDDQRDAKAELAVIVSTVLPKGVTSFNLIDGVWVTDLRCAIPVGIALRQLLVETSAARQAGEGQQTKMEMVYQYLTGPRFRQRIAAIAERFEEMQADLERERRTMTRLWAKREEQIRGAVESTVGMYGDLQGIAGKSLEEIEGLSLRAIEAPKPADDTEPGK